VAPPEDGPIMVKKTVKKKVKKLVKRKKSARKTRGRGKKNAEVVTVDDDEWIKKVLSDDEYFEKLDTEALEWFKENGPKVDTAGDKGLKCTCCFKNVTMVLGSATGMTRHFLLGVGVCKQCKFFYKDGEGWEKDDDGLDIYCRWCGQGGEIVLCDKCPKAFCKKCISRNLGRQKMGEITSAEEWKCFCCDPKQLYEKQAEYWAVWQRFKSGNYKKPAELKKEAKEAAEKKEKAEKEKKINQMMKRPKNFIDENLAEAFKTLNVYQRCLEQERDRWLKSGQQANLTNGTSICRALRKIYAITKQNMDLLDKAVVQSFVENFPRESTRIHMGKVGIKVKDGALTGKPTKIKGSTKVKLKTPPPKAKKKTPAKKAAPKSAKKGKTQEVVRPSLSGGSKGRMSGPASKRGGGGVKLPLYTKKKATRYSSDDDSDVQIVGDSSDEEDHRPGPASRKRKRPAPSPASAKKRRPGPKSRTM